MKGFVQYLTEDKDRFIKKNRNLTDDQKNELIKFFKSNRQAEAKVDWNKSKRMTYDDFVDIMMQSSLGRKTKLKPQKISGLREGTDYIHVKMKAKNYLAYIPLNYEAAQTFNTKKMGVCHGDWCIGHSSTPAHWNEEVIESKQVPIYLVNTESKWVVMIHEGNKKYDVWDIDNMYKKKHMGVPDFSIRKNLLTPKLKALYDEIREDYYDEEEEHPEIDISAAEEDYDSLVSDINSAEGAYDNARQEWYEYLQQIRRDTKALLEDKIDDWNNQDNDLESLFDDGEEIRDSLDAEREDWEDEGGEGDEPTATFDGEDYLTVEEIDDRLETIEQKRANIEEEINKLSYELDRIDEVEDYDMSSSDIDWSEDPPDEDYIYDDVNIPSVYDRAYEDYIELMEEHMGFSLRHSGDSVDGDIREFAWGEGSSTAEELLMNHELYHPDVVNEH